ncbi:hypothetical protein CK203_046329 [Vitis vinifera]|uniref:Uncharacterized protein n=1 Tax=Vitis vinifera TaxID=29760 RepID=A0A438FW78_VITVI|nr:hypothetical protein CK203_046329 [Vitis vinifera]
MRILMESKLKHNTTTKGIASSSRTLPSRSLINEDEDGEMVDLADKEDGEGYKCDDGNDDDDFVI